MRMFILTFVSMFLFISCSSEDKKDVKELAVKEEVVAQEEFVDEKVEETISEDIIVVVKDGKTLYKSCSSCHGLKGDAKALGVSKPINDYSKEELLTIFKGYKDGTYGGEFKTIMKAHIDARSEQELELLADYISMIKEN